MTIDQARSTNGRDPRDDRRPDAIIGGPATRRPRVRLSRLAVPVALALGVILLLRHFEQSTSR